MNSNEHDWYVDSGASNHMTSRSDWFASKQALISSQSVITGDNIRHPITHMGKVPVHVHDSSMKGLKDVLYEIGRASCRERV